MEFRIRPSSYRIKWGCFEFVPKKTCKSVNENTNEGVDMMLDTWCRFATVLTSNRDFGAVEARRCAAKLLGAPRKD
jgi:hypothetical protein